MTEDITSRTGSPDEPALSTHHSPDASGVTLMMTHNAVFRSLRLIFLVVNPPSSYPHWFFLFPESRIRSAYSVVVLGDVPLPPSLVTVMVHRKMNWQEKQVGCYWLPGLAIDAA